MILILVYSSFGLLFGIALWSRFLGRRGLSEVLVEWLWVSLLIISLLAWEFIGKGNVVEVVIFDWFWVIDSSFSLRVGRVSGGMVILIELITSLVVWYSVGYMEGDRGRSRLLGLIIIFKLSMIILVTSSNLVTLFAGWEGVGVVSFGLITYWYTGLSNGRSGIQAMLMNKIGDLVLLVSLVWLYLELGSLDWGLVTEGLDGWIRLLIVVACVAKSGQVGLHLWLPNAMAAPTPISALLHSATMVTAGVYLGVVLGLGGKWIVLLSGYSLLAIGSLGLVEYDYKKIIAYSTGSQLGYMLVGVGLFEFDVGYFHLLVHAVFKSTLFLSSGLVLYVCSDEQDIRRLGGLVSVIPLGYIASLVGSVSLLGLPYLSGYYSKEGLLLRSLLVDYDGWWLLMIGVVVTAYYGVRVFYQVYLVTYRGDRLVLGGLSGDNQSMYWVLLIISQLAIIWGYLLVDCFSGGLVGSNICIIDSEGEGWVGDFVLIGVILGSWLGLQSWKWRKWWLFTFADSWGYDRCYKNLVSGLYYFGDRVVWRVGEKGLNEGLGGWGNWDLFVQGEEASDGLLVSYVIGGLVWFIIVFVVWC